MSPNAQAARDAFLKTAQSFDNLTEIQKMTALWLLDAKLNRKQKQLSAISPEDYEQAWREQIGQAERHNNDLRAGKKITGRDWGGAVGAGFAGIGLGSMIGAFADLIRDARIERKFDALRKAYTRGTLSAELWGKGINDIRMRYPRRSPAKACLTGAAIGTVALPAAWLISRLLKKDALERSDTELKNTTIARDFFRSPANRDRLQEWANSGN